MFANGLQSHLYPGPVSLLTAYHKRKSKKAGRAPHASQLSNSTMPSSHEATLDCFRAMALVPKTSCEQRCRRIYLSYDAKCWLVSERIKCPKLHSPYGMSLCSIGYFGISAKQGGILDSILKRGPLGCFYNQLGTDPNSGVWNVLKRAD